LRLRVCLLREEAMEYIPPRHATKVGMHYPARVTAAWLDSAELVLDLTRVAPGRSPFLRALLEFNRTVSLPTARSLNRDDTVTVVLIGEYDRDYDWVYVSLPADPAWLNWNNQTVRHLARRIRKTGETVLLPVLADALEEAGCTDATLLDHCRQLEVNGSRSWVVELLATQE
jgi:hypothetical protein